MKLHNFRENVAYILKIKKWNCSQFTKLICKHRGFNYTNAYRRQISRMLNRSNSKIIGNTKYIRLEDVVIIAAVLDIKPCMLAFGDVKDINKHYKIT